MRTFLNAILLLMISFTSAQTLTQSSNEPGIGDVDKNYRLDTSAYTSGLPSAVTGSNVVWDFTKVTGAFPVIIDSIISPSAAPGSTAYPGASYCQKRDDIYSYFKSSSSPSQTEWLGAYTTSLSITFTNSALVAAYPVNYGYSHSDQVTGTFKYNSTSGVCNGVITVQADGLGTLNLPNNVSFQNVLRLRSIEHLTMTVGFLSVGKIDQSIFNYYAPGKKYPVLTVQYQEYQLIAGTPTITAQAYGNFSYFTVAGLQPHNSELTKVYPNPISEILNIENAGNVKSIALINSQGRVIRTALSAAELEVHTLPAGAYILNIENETGCLRRKIFKN